MNSSVPNPNLAFSTITKKSPLVAQNQNVAQSQTVVTKFKELADSRDKKYTTIVDPQAKYNVNTDNLRESLVIDQAEMNFSLYKKSKKTSKILQRTAKLAQTDLLHVLQDKNRKQYSTPARLAPETYAQYQLRMSTSTPAQKKLILPWAPKTEGKAEYRIAFVRRPDARPDAGAEAKVDSAFYFDKKEEFEKAKNYLKFIELLENRKGENPLHALLNNLNMAFKGQLTAKFRKLISARAKLIQKETLVRNTNLLLTSDANLTNSLTTRWLRFVRDRDYLKREQDRAMREQDRAARDRIESLSNTIRRSSLILTLNSYLVGAMLEAWKSEAEARIQSYKEDIALFLDCIEVSSSIIQPSLKVEVTVNKDYPESLVINNTRIRDKALDRTLDFRLNCRIKGPKTPQVYYWNIVPAEVLPTERSSQYGNVQEELFALRFNEYILDHLDLIEIKFLLSDESETVKAYQYVSLKSLYAASKKGNNVWLSMNTSHKGNLNAPLLHIKAFSNRVDHSNENVFDVGTAGISNLETIHDAFYNYHFDIPAITPKHDKILELLPASWNVIDEKTKSLKRSEKFGDFVNTIKEKLAKHYYETTSRQLARLGKSAQTWAALQDELISYIPKKENNNVSQLYLDEQYIKNLVGLQKPVIEEGGADDDASQDEYHGIVSYLFKRDKWESKEEWYSFYQKLGALCRKGLPLQHRLNIWSEMSRVVYFVDLTENEHKKQRGVRRYEQANLDPDMNDRSRKVDNIYKKSKIVYDQLKKDAEKEFIYLYQELEDDLDFLREQYESSEKQKIPHERNLRNICRTFIFWSKLFSDPSTEEKIRYFVAYSRAILILCHGLITCQTCSYMEQEAVVEEEQVFWNLISLATYILSSYFETNEDSVSVDKLTFKEGEERKKNKITNSALRCNQIKGIKGDLLILKILLKEYEPEIYFKFEELGLPLEFYFADHMLTLFFNLFNPGLTFRIWDVLFFEGSGANQVRCNRMIVCFLFALLRECKPMLLKAKKASDINFVIETYAKFQTKYGAFIKQAYQVSKDYFEQALPRDQTFFEKLSYIKFALFASDYNKLDKRIRSIEQSIEGNYFTYTLQQNMALFALANSKYQYRPDSDETLSYTVLARMIKDFQSDFGVKTSETKAGKEADYNDEPAQKRYKLFQDVNIDTRKFLKGRMSTLHFRIHSLVTYWPNLEDLSVVVVYGKEKQKKKDLQAFNVEFEGVFSLNKSREIPRYLNLEIVDEKDPMNPQKIKYLSIDLKRVAFEVPTKLNLKFREENPNVYNSNHITSEVELTLLLEGAEAAHDVKIDYGLFFTVPELENPIYDTFRDKDFSQTITAGHNDEGEVERPTYHGGASFLRDRHAWKENFAVDYEEFLKIMKQIAPFWVNNADLSKIYDTISKANRNNTFYITDFFVLLVLFGKFTSIQKFGLLFDLFTGFDDTFTDRTREVPYHVLKGLCAYIFDLFMIYMPYNELENIVDLTVYGDIANIKKVTINGQVTIKNEVIKQHLNRLSNFMHASYNTKELHLYQEPVLDILRTVYEKEIARTFEQPINKIEITYMTNGMPHKLRFDIDENWKIVEDPADGRKSAKAGARVLANYRNVVALQNTPKIFSRNEFIKVMQKLPLINYLCSLEHTEISNTLVYLNNVKFTVNMEGEPVYTVIPTHEPIPEQVLTNPKKNFRTVLREWDDIVRVSGYKAGSKSNLGSSRSNFRGNKMKPSSEAQKIPSAKLNLFFSHNQLISYIKRTIIKSISETFQKSSGQADQYNPLLFNKNLLELDYAVTLIVNKTREFEITDKKKSPFKTLVELMERISNEQRDIEEVEIVYNIKNTTIPEIFFEPYNQLALYRYSEGSTEWLPSKIKYKFKYVRRDEYSDNIDGYGVVFSKFPDETVLKKSSEVAIIKTIDLEELELKQVDPLTSKAVTIDRAAAGFSPQRQQANIPAGGGPKVLFQKPSDDDDDNLFGANPQGSAYAGQKVRSGIPGLYDGVPRDEEEDQFGGRLKVTH